MKLTLEGLADRDAWNKAGWELPAFDYQSVRTRTLDSPCWIHFGAGNIFRAFHARILQELLDRGLWDRGVTAVSGTNPSVIKEYFHPHDNLSLLVTLGGNGALTKTVVASIMESLPAVGGDAGSLERLRKIFSSSSLQMASFTITEKGYALRDASGAYRPDLSADLARGPESCKSYLGLVTSLLYTRFQKGRAPLAMVSMDNCSHNGDVLKESILTIAGQWQAMGMVPGEFISWISNPSCVSFPWTMIDKITPRPDDEIRNLLARDGIEDLDIRSGVSGSVTAPFVNAEECEYLVVEEAFPAGRPPLEKAGVLFTSRRTVERAERMKVCTCLNPLHTALAIYGCLLGFRRISEEMEDSALRRLALSVGFQEGMPVVCDPGILHPEQFLREAVSLRISNPYLPDTPWRIATDTSQKLSVRFGETLKAYQKRPDLSTENLVWIPLVFAGWLRYLMAVDDTGQPFVPSPDPQLSRLSGYMKNFHLGEQPDADEICRRLEALLEDSAIWGTDLNACGISRKTAECFRQMLAGPGAVRQVLNAMEQLPTDGIPADLL